MIPTVAMAEPPYTLRFPCPECSGLLTMHHPAASGPCPLCRCHITVELNVTKVEDDAAPGEQRAKLTWDKRAFRRCPSADKPRWKKP